MTPEQRTQEIETRLQSAFAPTELQVIDESHKHVGHAGAKDGRGHFHVIIASSAFDGLSPIARHRAIYDAMGDLMKTDIHALSIDARVGGQG
ncbi:BolA family transcriptional regulator [Marinihelvus fidelis]|uniref:BolA family transcriptional regulator n=1 Tax=Marinihelvus fidelis TaxID=2613842 RepID=A0A5N0TEU6_9GAMM|nr:BolA family protein [Marinihelvus fidelis]KAA9133098.1 BolA family transcriptional regulator [Marinihelvus fidelis]